MLCAFYLTMGGAMLKIWYPILHGEYHNET